MIRSHSQNNIAYPLVKNLIKFSKKQMQQKCQHFFDKIFDKIKQQCQVEIQHQKLQKELHKYNNIFEWSMFQKNISLVKEIKLFKQILRIMNQEITQKYYSWSIRKINEVKQLCQEFIKLKKMKLGQQLMSQFYRIVSQSYYCQLKIMQDKLVKQQTLKNQFFKDMRKQQNILINAQIGKQINLFTLQNSKRWKKDIQILSQIGIVRQSSLDIKRDKNNISSKRSTSAHARPLKNRKFSITQSLLLWQNSILTQNLYLPENNKALRQLLSSQQHPNPFNKQTKNRFKFFSRQVKQKLSLLFEKNCKAKVIAQKDDQINSIIIQPTQYCSFSLFGQDL